MSLKSNQTSLQVIVTALASQVALVVKNLPANSGDIRDAGSIPGSGRSLGGGHGNPLQCSCLENPMDRRAWRATVHGIPKSKTPLSAHTLLRVPFMGPMVGFYPSILVEQSKKRKEEVARTGSLTTASGESSHGPQPE